MPNAAPVAPAAASGSNSPLRDGALQARLLARNSAAKIGLARQISVEMGTSCLVFVLVLRATEQRDEIRLRIERVHQHNGFGARLIQESIVQRPLLSPRFFNARVF
jgi:hypothetical protein